MQLRANNHFVPASYLRRWAGGDGRISTYRLLVNHPSVPVWDRQSPRGLARLRHLYTSTLAGGETDEMERWLDTEFESPASNVIEMAISGARLSRGNYRVLARFVAAQDVRTPARLREVLERGREDVPAVMQKTLERSVRELERAIASREALPPVPESTADAFPARVRIRPGPDGEHCTIQVEATVGRGYWQFQMRRLLTKTVEHLCRHRWTILRAPTGVRWVTSDDPVIKLSWNGPDSYDFGGGWGSHGTEIILPLSPTYVLYTAIGRRPPPRGTMVALKTAMWMQEVFIKHADRFIFAVEPDPTVEAIRPRCVDSVAFENEREQWRRWHDENQAAERAILTK